MNNYATYLGREEGYDPGCCFYSPELPAKVFFVLNKGHTLCVGVFYFKVPDTDSFAEVPSSTQDEILALQELGIKVSCSYDEDEHLLVITQPIHRLQRLQTAWIHPFHRHQGIFGAIWPVIKEECPIFSVDTPSA